MADYDVIVIGGGPAGYAAALRAAELGAKVALVEPEKPGGSCVHHACIPTNIMLGAAIAHVEAREFGVMGVFDVGEQFNFARAAARKDALVKKMSDGIAAALRMRKVTVIAGRAAFAGPGSIEVDREGGKSTLTADAFVIATGTRWHPPEIPGVAPERVLTADAVQALATAPASAVVLGGGPAETAFALEYAVLLAAAGSSVTVASARDQLLPGLDRALSAAAKSALADMGITVFEGATVSGRDAGTIDVKHGAGIQTVDAEIIVAADVRRPFFESLNLDAAGVRTRDAIHVDRQARTNVPSIYAAGDVTGGTMLTNVATRMGEVAGENAGGGNATARLHGIPHLLHTVPEIAWCGLSEEAARAEGHDVVTGAFDLGYNARAITLGAREGIVKVVAERELGEVLGVHAVGPGASELMAVAATVIQAEVTVHDLAAMVYWHPSIAEGLVEAARRAIAAMK